MGGRGAGSGGGGGASGGLNPKNIVSTTSLISAREGNRSEVDQTLSVLRDVENRYGVDVTDAKLAKLKGRGNGVLAYYDSQGNLAINQSYFDSNKMDKVYDESVKSGFHPSRGNKTAIQAVTAHEMGHRLTDEAGRRATGRGWEIDSTSKNIISQASKDAGYGRQTRRFMSKISGYASHSHAEAVAESFADVYCNGNNASRESRAVVNVLNSYF